jgi:hypothetical protein
MAFQTKKFQKFQYKRSSPPTELVVESTVKQDGRKIDSFSFKNNSGFKIVIGALKKYGFVIDDKNEVAEEIANIQKQRSWIDKQEGDSEW